jgi:hypothetical protein
MLDYRLSASAQYCAPRSVLSSPIAGPEMGDLAELMTTRSPGRFCDRTVLRFVIFMVSMQRPSHRWYLLLI